MKFFRRKTLARQPVGDIAGDAKETGRVTTQRVNPALVNSWNQPPARMRVLCRVAAVVRYIERQAELPCHRQRQRTATAEMSVHGNRPFRTHIGGAEHGAGMVEYGPFEGIAGCRQFYSV